MFSQPLKQPHTKYWLRSNLIRTSVAIMYAVCSFWLIVQTNDMGYTRDESFYFKYAVDYTDWMVQLDTVDEDGQHPMLERAAIHRTWRGNFEHPPLVKVMMGFFWREFARVERPAKVLSASAKQKKASPGNVRVRVTAVNDREYPITPSHPFDEGTKVAFLAPQGVNQAPDDPVRLLATGTVEKRNDGSVDVLLSSARGPDGQEMSEADFKVICSAYKGGSKFIRGCSIVRDGPLMEGSAMRLVGPFFTALLIFAMVLFGWTQLHPVVGLTAPLLFLSTPRWFFHAHMAAFDMPVVAMIFIVSAAFWVSLKRPAWAWITAVLWGIGLLTKHNALFAVIPLVGFWLLAYRNEFSLETHHRPSKPLHKPRAVATVGLLLLVLFLGSMASATWAFLTTALLFLVVSGWRIRFPRIPLAFLVMPPIGLTMLFALWPKLWVDPFRAVETYLNFHVKHEHYLQYYMGRVLQAPPFPMELPFVLSALTIPALTLLVGLVGSADLMKPSIQRTWSKIRKSPLKSPSGLETTRERLALFLLIQALFPIILIALPTTPIFGGVKHWMTGMPFFCLLGGWGIWKIAKVIASLLGTRRRSASYALSFFLSICVLGPATYATHRTRAIGNAHYAELAGGISGAADLKLTRIYWGYSSQLAFPHINRTLRPGSRVWFHDTTPQAFNMYRNEGRIRHDLKWAWSPTSADASLFEEQKFFAKRQLEIQRNYDLAGPSWSWRIEGVPMISLYVRQVDFLKWFKKLTKQNPTAKTSISAPARPQKSLREGDRNRPAPKSPNPGPAREGPGTPGANRPSR